MELQGRPRVFLIAHSKNPHFWGKTVITNMLVSNAERELEDWMSGDDPTTGAQLVT